MKNKYCTAVILGVMFLLPLAGKAQQTYFNVPSSDIIEKHKVAVQQQINIGETIRSSTTFDYGIGREWEAGFNLYNLDYSPSEHSFVHNDSTTKQAFGPLLLLNMQKAFDIAKNLRLAVGVQGGINLSPAHHSELEGYLYTNLAGSLQDEHYKWSLGGYTANPRFLGDGPVAGFQAGFDAGIFYQKVHLLGDWVSGEHDFGQLVLGAEVYLGKHVPLAVGWQRTNKDGMQAVVVQLTYTPQ